ncbi:MAG TPA: hypothetical protein P5110_05285 [Candidatus Omnitrophota bacterium]|nr:hypothetical protein [Candidatus Omnitrophota bacterium]
MQAGWYSRIAIACMLLGAACPPARAAAAQTGRLEQAREFVVASALKTAAKGFIATGGLAKVKAKIETLDDRAFARDYAQTYAYLKDYPALVKQESLRPNMSRKEVLRIIGTWDNAKVFRMIDGLPNHTVAAHFQHYVGVTTDEVDSIDVRRAARDIFERLSK